MEIRLNKYISQSGICSRRKADQLIKEGKVKVNNQIVKDLGIKINSEKDKVSVEGKEIKPSQKEICIKLYKPVGYLTQLGKDKFGKKTLSDLFKEVGIKENIFPVGRLDYESEGLLLLTNNGDFAYKISHPKFKVPKTYVVEIDRRISHSEFNKLVKGTKLEDGFMKPDEIKILKKKRNSTILEITIHSGKKRIIRRYMKAFGYNVKRLIRTKIGNIDLEGLDEKKVWKYMNPDKVKESFKRYDKGNNIK